MAHRVNDLVIYLKGGKERPAIVLKSQPHPDGEFLTLLYADDSAETLINSGRAKDCGDVDIAVRPFSEGSTNSWKEDTRLSGALARIAELDKKMAAADKTVGDQNKQIAALKGGK